MFATRSYDIVNGSEQPMALGILAPLRNGTFRLPPLDMPKPARAVSAIRSPWAGQPWIGHGGRDLEPR
jgi:hypothetical protein